MAGSLKPQQIGPNDWYYGENGHLLLVHEIREIGGAYIKAVPSFPRTAL